MFSHWLTLADKENPQQVERKACCYAPCGKSDCDMSSCSGCRSVTYCSAVCQKADWKAGHKKACIKRSVVAEPTVEALRVGSHVRLHSLSKAELNGRAGFVVAALADRWSVALHELDGPAGAKKLFAIKAVNLEVLPSGKALLLSPPSGPDASDAVASPSADAAAAASVAVGSASGSGVAGLQIGVLDFGSALGKVDTEKAWLIKHMGWRNPVSCATPPSTQNTRPTPTCFVGGTVTM